MSLYRLKIIVRNSIYCVNSIHVYDVFCLIVCCEIYIRAVAYGLDVIIQYRFPVEICYTPQYPHVPTRQRAMMPLSNNLIMAVLFDYYEVPSS